MASPEPNPGAKPQTTGLPANVAAALACIPLIGGIIFYILEKRNRFVRFYAMQSIIFGGVWILFSIVYSNCASHSDADTGYWHCFYNYPGHRMGID